MSLNTTPAAERIHIGIFGKRNAGKSSLINAITSQNLAIVSEQKGTTTDPVYKAMELLPLGPVMVIDTPGIDDEGELGKLRIEKAYQVLNKCDIVLLVVDAQVGLTHEDEALWAKVQEKNLPAILVLNKIDAIPSSATLTHLLEVFPTAIPISSKTGEGLERMTAAVSSALSREFLDVYVELPISDGRTAASLARDGEVTSREYDPNGLVTFHARLPKFAVERLRAVNNIVVRIGACDAKPYFENK